MGLDPCVRLALAREAARSLVRLGQVRGTSVKTERRVARAAAVLVGAVGLVGSVPLVEVAHAATPQFRQFPFNLTNVGKNAKPTFADIDGDGDLDAFVGERYGNTFFFRNTGSSSAPAFASPLTNPFGLVDVGDNAKPTFVDIDGDGDLDAFIGNEDGNTIFFRNTGSSSAPAFASPSTNPFGLADVGYTASPTFVDIDGDGDLDAFIGEGDGKTIFFRNTGSSSAPALASPSTSPFGLSNVGYTASPTFVDIDGDGDLDAFVGNSDGNTLFFENTGSSNAPAFASASTNPFGLVDVGSNASPAFADIDGDGDLDAFIGNIAGTTIFFRKAGSSSAAAFTATAINPFGFAGVGGNASPAFADIDGDGDLDAFIGNSDGNTIFFRNAGSSSAAAFAAPSANPFDLVDVGFISSPTFVDIDGDGDLDAFIGNSYGDTIFFENTGSSTAAAFASALTNPFGLADVGDKAKPTFVDIDGDGDLDAFVGNSYGDTIFFENTGSSSVAAFTGPATNPFGFVGVGGTASPTFADIDGDGDLDAFIGRSDGDTIFFENTGSSNAPAFATPSSNPYGLTDVGLNAKPAFADIDGDGDLDAFIGNSDGNTIFFRNTGSSSAAAFAASSANPFGLANVGYDSSPTFADIDGDGDLDAFIGNSDGNTIFFRNTGSSSAAAFAASSANPFGLANVGYDSSPTFADIDGDGDLDAFIGAGDGNTVFFRNTGSSSAPAFAAPSANPFGLANVGYDSSPTFADIDGDGDLDAFIGAGDGNTVFFRNTGSSSAPAFAAPSANPFGLANVGYDSSPTFADIDGDGDLDAFIGNDGGDTIFFRNTGSSSAAAFAASSANPFGLADVGYDSSPAFADIDGDGDLDVFIGNSDGNTIFFENTGSSSAAAFAASSANPFRLADVGFESSPAFADIDGDGDLDAFIGNSYGETIFFENTGSSSAAAFAASSANPFGLADVGFQSSPAFADIDGDGDLDAFIGRSDGDTIFFENTGSSSAAAFTGPATNPFGFVGVGGTASPTFADIDGDGDLDAFIGRSDGDTIFFENTGSSSAPAFAAASTNPFGLADVGYFASPTFADIDGDGDLDAFIGEFYGSTIFFENTGSSSAPAFAAPSANPFGLADVGYTASPTFVDIDGDGDLDAFIGEISGDTIFFENIGCGNGGLDAGEECDDGNAVGGDGCSASCMLEGTPPPTPTSTPSHTPTPSVTPTPTSTPSHTPTPSVTPTPADNDNDGVPDAVENAGPNGGDGNGDGTPDSQQPHVASLPGARGGGAYQTMVTDSACPIRNLAAVALSPPGFNLPFGALAFELPGCESTRVTIYYHGVDSLSAPPMEYVKQGPNPPGASNNVVYTLSSGAPHTRVFGSANLGFDTAVGFASFTLSDNVVGDDTGDDDVIVDQGGPGFSTAAPVPVASGWGVLGSLLMLLGVGWRRLWRR